MRSYINNSEMRGVVSDYRATLLTDPNLTFARYCRTQKLDYQRVRSWLYRYKGMTILELRTGIIKTQVKGAICKMKGRDKHKDIEPLDEPCSKVREYEVTETAQMMEVIDEVVFELPRIGVKTILRNVPIRQFHIILASIASKYGEPTEVRKQSKVKTS